MPHELALQRDEVVEEDLTVTQGKGETTVVAIRAEPLQLSGIAGRRVAVVASQDVTAQRAHVEQLQSFAGVVAHDLQNPLAAVTSWAELLRDHLATNKRLD